MEGEVWADIPGLIGYYQASNFGKVRSLTRMVNRSRGGLQIHRGKVLNGHTGRSGYVTVVMSTSGKIRTNTVHRLVMSAFHGCSSLVVDHIDGNKSNNNLSNLRYCTQRENLCSGKQAPGVYTNPPNYKKMFRARINVGGKLIELGSYATKEEASKAYQSHKNKIENGTEKSIINGA